MKLVRHIMLSTAVGRRAAMEAIRSGMVRVNGRPATSASLEVDPGRDTVLVDGRPVRPLPPLHLVMYKPRATVCTRSDPEGRATVYDLVKPRFRRAVTVGRLDYHTTGVLLMTTDGELAQRLMLPRHGVARSYRVRLKGAVTEQVLERWRQGVRIGGRSTRPATIRRVATTPTGSVVTVTLREGRNRQIHEMARATGLVAAKIHRERFGPVTLVGLRPGQVRELTAREVRKLRVMVGLA